MTIKKSFPLQHKNVEIPVFENHQLSLLPPFLLFHLSVIPPSSCAIVYLQTMPRKSNIWFICSSWNLSKIECRPSVNDNLCPLWLLFDVFLGSTWQRFVGGETPFFFLLYYRLTSCKNELVILKVMWKPDQLVEEHPNSVQTTLWVANTRSGCQHNVSAEVLVCRLCRNPDPLFHSHR